MRKLGRMVRRVLTAVSLLLFVAVLAAWVRGYWRWDTCWVERESMNETGWRFTLWRVEWGGGEVCVSHSSVYANAGEARAAGMTPGVQWKTNFLHQAPGRVGRWYARIADDIKSIGGMGWTWDHGGVVLGRVETRGPLTVVRDAHSEWHFLAFPCWMAAIVFGALPSWRGLVWWRGVRRRRLASREGRCGVCGYDLRASPGRCPECGTAVGGKGE